MNTENYYSAVLGQILKEWHESQNLTVYAIAKELGGNRSAIDRLESGEKITSEVAFKYLYWVYRKNPNIFGEYVQRIAQYATDHERKEYLKWLAKEQERKDKEEAKRLADQKARITEEVKAEFIAALDAAEAAATSAKIEAAQAQAAEDAIRTAKESLEAAEIRAKHQASEIERLREENEKLNDLANKMRKAPLWRRIFGRF